MYGISKHAESVVKLAYNFLEWTGSCIDRRGIGDPAESYRTWSKKDDAGCTGAETVEVLIITNMILLHHVYSIGAQEREIKHMDDGADGCYSLHIRTVARDPTN